MAVEQYKIQIVLSDIEQPFSLTVKSTEEERIFREAGEMINAYYKEYKQRIKGLNSTAYYGMVAFLMARLYIESHESKTSLENALSNLEKEIKRYFE